MNYDLMGCYTVPIDNFTTQFPDLTPDWGLSDSIEATVNEVKLGDGYVQRIRTGINTNRTKWSIAFSFLDREQSDAVYSWLKPKLKVVQFLWTHPVTLEEHTVVCTELSRVHSDVGLHPVRATFEEDFNPRTNFWGQ